MVGTTNFPHGKRHYRTQRLILYRRSSILYTIMNPPNSLRAVLKAIRRVTNPIHDFEVEDGALDLGEIWNDGVVHPD